MKNQIFNFKRFGRYASGTLILRYRQILLLSGAAVAGIFIFSFFTLLNNQSWDENRWLELIIPLTIVCGLLYAGSAFPSFRSREKTLGYLMIPSSSFEKILYEFIERIVAFTLIFPLFLYLFGNLAANMVIRIKQFKHLNFNIEHLSLINLIQRNNNGSVLTLFTGSIAVFLLVFAGAVTFKKYPLVKTIIFSMIILFAISGYFYLIFEKMELRNPWIEKIGNHLHNEQAFTILTIASLIFSVITLFYSYFKLKEKEVS